MEWLRMKMFKYFKFYWGPSEQLSESNKGQIPPLNADFPSSPSLGSRMSQGKHCSEGWSAAVTANPTPLPLWRHTQPAGPRDLTKHGSHTKFHGPALLGTRPHLAICAGNTISYAQKLS